MFPDLQSLSLIYLYKCVSHFVLIFVPILADQMAHLSEDLFCIKASVLDLTSRVDLVKHLSKGLPVLVPYDCDKNHDPIEKSGQSAHWATLLGFSLEMDESDDKGKKCNILHMAPPLHGDTVKSICSSLLRDEKELLLFAKQGKSKFMRLWKFDKLSASNRNLRFVNDSCLKGQANGSTCSVLAEDLSKSLANKAVFLSSLQ